MVQNALQVVMPSFTRVNPAHGARGKRVAGVELGRLSMNTKSLKFGLCGPPLEEGLGTDGYRKLE